MTSQQIICAPSSSSSSSLVSLKKYDVFLSFRGEDTRRNFTSHLYDALQKKVKTFIDDNELQKGDSISPRLTEAIEESYISIVIFSKDYTSSNWCLNELIKILECKNDWGQIVIPIFHNIDPSHIRKQTGSYQKAFEKHEQDMKLNKDMLQKWKDALFEASNLAGFDSSKYRNEAGVVKDIVEYVLRILKPRYPFKVEERGLVGIEPKYEVMKSLLEMGSNDVRSIGVWGMGGIGKTTLVEVLIAELYSQFEGYCFLKNVREESQKHGLDVVRHKLFSALLEEENLRPDAPWLEIESIMRRLLGKKLLIVLDDVATSEQMESLMLYNNVLGQGSRVIVTTRNKHIIRHVVHAIYEVKELDTCGSLELFCLNAFRENHPKTEYEELSRSAISYCKGNPLALKVLGARLSFRSKIAWESDLKKLQNMPDEKIHNVLKLCYDDLDPTQKDIFLDIACFFKGWDINRVISVLEACGFYPTSGLEVLKDKALITIQSDDNYNAMHMHDLIQEMGQQIVIQKSIKEPGERSRLWKCEEVADVLKNNMGTEAVEGIRLDAYLLGEDLYLSTDSFKRMPNLRFLEIHSINDVYLPDGLEWLSNKLRYLEWDSFPLESLPSTFCAKMLVELHMNDSNLKKLWDGVQNLLNLKVIDISHSKDLIEIPDLSRATNLERVYLEYCYSLCELHPSVLSLPKLEVLDLSFCKKIKSLKSNIHSKSLCTLDLQRCSSLAEFSVTSEAMTRLSLSKTAIHELPSSIWRNSKLEVLELEGCEELSIVGKKLSDDPGILGSVRSLAPSSSRIDALNLSFLLDGIQSSLEELYLVDCCNLETLPHNLHKHSELKTIKLDGCTKLVLSSPTELLLPSLQQLSAINCTTFMDTNSTQRLLLDNMLRCIVLNDAPWRGYFLLMPGDQVPDTFGFQGENSIIIPHLPISNLKGFFFCVVLSEGMSSFDLYNLDCYICEHGEEVGKIKIGDFCQGEGMIKIDDKGFISDHVLVSCWRRYDYERLGIGEGEGDHYNIEFKFQYFDFETAEWSTDGIKGCGVLPVYDLELDDKSSSNHRLEIVELESSSTAQACDVDEFEAGAAIGDDDLQQPPKKMKRT